VPLGALLLIVAVLVLWAFLVTHVTLVARIFGVTEITTRERLIALIVPMWVGWKAGKKRHAVLWCCLIVLYVVVRIVLALR